MIFLFAPTKISKRNLYQENINHKKIYVVGNTISDALNLSKKKIDDAILKKLHIKKKKVIFYLPYIGLIWLIKKI